jgi:hypothetical protein
MLNKKHFTPTSLCMHHLSCSVSFLNFRENLLEVSSSLSCDLLAYRRLPEPLLSSTPWSDRPAPAASAAPSASPAQPLTARAQDTMNYSENSHRQS